MAWNLQSHILDHAHLVHDKLNSKRQFDANDSNNQHFTFSSDIAQLLSIKCQNQKAIDEKMTAFMNDLVAYEKSYRVSKGLNSKGEKVYRDQKFNFNDDVLLAYHNSASDSTNSNNYSVNPHFHFLAHKSLKVGMGYSYLREAITEVSQKHGIVFNLDEETGREKVDSKDATNLTWFLKRATDADFRRQMSNGGVKASLEKFQEHYKQTGNLQYLLKGYRDLEMRAKRLNITHDLNLNLFLVETQLSSIKTLYSGDKAAIYELLSDRKNHIGRAFLEKSFGFENIIIDEIEKRTGQKIPLFEIDLNRVNVKIEQKVKIAGDYTKTINFCYEEDLKTALNYAKNEKDLAAIMQSMGYTNFAFRQKNIAGKRQRVGFTFLNKNNKIVTVYFSNINTDMKSVRAKLVSNAQNPERPETLKSHLRDYTPPQKPSKSNLVFEEIYNLKTSLDLKDFYIKELDNHVEFRTKGTFILDRGDEILVKKSQKSDLERNVTLLADMVESKKWTNFKIQGSQEFKTAMRAELDKRAAQREQEAQKLKIAALEQTIASLLEKRSDTEILQELSTLNLRTADPELHKNQFMQLYKIRKNALDEKALEKLLKTYEIEGTESEFEIREKIVNLGKCLSISKNEVLHEMGLEMGLKSVEEIEAHKDYIQSLDNYDELFLSKFTQLVGDKLTDKLLLADDISDNLLERNIRTLEGIYSEFDSYKDLFIGKKEYAEQLKNATEAISNNSFYEAQTLINSLDAIDKTSLNSIYEQEIDKAIQETNYEQIEEKIKKEEQGIQRVEQELETVETVSEAHIADNGGSMQQIADNINQTQHYVQKLN